MCSEPQTGELACESENLRNLNSLLCPLVHTNEVENMNSNSKESVNLDQKEENSGVPGHIGDYLGTTKISGQSNRYPIEQRMSSEFISHQGSQESSVENSDYSSSKEENLRNCIVQQDSGIRSGKPHSEGEDLQIQDKEIKLKKEDEKLMQKESKPKNKLVRSCRQTHIDNLCSAAKQKNEICVQTCPWTSVDSFQSAEQRKNEKLSESCPQTTRDNISAR